jgi:hypothetical protein
MIKIYQTTDNWSIENSYKFLCFKHKDLHKFVHLTTWQYFSLIDMELENCIYKRN